MSAYIRILHYIEAYTKENRFFNVGPISYDTQLAWKLVNKKIIPSKIDDLPVNSYLRHVGFDPDDGPSDGFKLHLDQEHFETMTEEEAREPGLLVKSAKLGPILISGNLRLAKLSELGVKKMKVYVIDEEYEPRVVHGSSKYKATLNEHY